MSNTTPDPTQSFEGLRIKILNSILIHEPECDLGVYGTPCDCVQQKVADNILQAITQAVKHLIREAKPADKPEVFYDKGKYSTVKKAEGFNQALAVYEAALLKALGGSDE